MKKNAVRLSALVLAFGMLMPFVVSCKKQPKSDTIDANYEWVVNTDLTDSSQIANYAGQNTMSLRAWNITSSYTRSESSNDVVTPEIKRITGVEIGNITDNKGQGANEAYYNLPSGVQIAYGRGWVNPDAVWDLTELIDTYCPTIKARMPKSVWNDPQITAGEKGKVYGIPYGLGNMGLSDLDPLATAENSPLFQYMNEPYPYILVREDVLKEAYPTAKTQAEINALFAQNGKFTEEELFDVPITSAQQFRTEFLPKIQNVLDTNPKYTNGSKKVKAMTVTSGSDFDTWDFLGVLVPKLLGGAGTHTNTQFTYWDKQTQKIELMMTQDWYLSEVEAWQKIVQEGKYVSKSDFDSSNVTIKTLLNNGMYAIAYGSSTSPNGNQATYTLPNGTTEKVAYRKVYMKIPLRENLEFFASGSPAVSSVMFLKDSVRESDLPQLLRWLDFQCSRLADKLYAWGPGGEGALFNETADGKRTYKDADLATQMVYSTGSVGSLVKKYNLANGTAETPQPTFPFVYANGSIYHPKSNGQYDLSTLEGIASTFFTSAVVCDDIKPKGLAKFPSLHTWSETDLPGVGEIWGQRNRLETYLKKLLTSDNFNNAVTGLKSTLQSAGWTDAYFNGQFTARFLTLNADFADQFYTNG